MDFGSAAGLALVVGSDEACILAIIFIAYSAYWIGGRAQKSGSLPFRVEHYSSNKSIDICEQEPSRCKKRCSAKRWGLPRPGL